MLEEFNIHGQFRDTLDSKESFKKQVQYFRNHLEGKIVKSMMKYGDSPTANVNCKVPRS